MKISYNNGINMSNENLPNVNFVGTNRKERLAGKNNGTSMSNENLANVNDLSLVW